MAKRVADFCECQEAPQCPEGVQPLNPGFFTLESMRLQGVAERKARAKKRGKVKSR